MTSSKRINLKKRRDFKKKEKLKRKNECAKRIQLCWKTNHIYPINMAHVFKTLLEIKIKNHENDDLKFYMEYHPDKLNGIIKDCDYASFYEIACVSKNYECIPILVKNGMGPDEFIRDYNEEWESWLSSPMRMAFRSLDANMICVLVKEGFDTGRGSTCPDCSECGWPETCLFETLFSPKDMEKISDEDLTKIIRVSNWNHVISTYERLTGDHFGKKMIDTSIMNRVQMIMCKTIPMIHMSFDITERNIDHVMEMVQNNLVNVDKLLQVTTCKFLGKTYSSFWDDVLSSDDSNEESDVESGINIPPLSVERVKESIKYILDAGADITTPFMLEYTSFCTSLPEKKGIFNEEIPYGSFEDIIRSVIDCKEETEKFDFGGFMCHSRDHIDDVFKALGELYSYIKYNKRVGYLQKRVRGFDDGINTPDEAIKNVMGADIAVFSNVMKYVV